MKLGRDNYDISFAFWDGIINRAGSLFCVVKTERVNIFPNENYIIRRLPDWAGNYPVPKKPPCGQIFY